MARNGGNADMRIRVEELEEIELGGSGRSRTPPSGNGSVGGGSNSGRGGVSQQQSPMPSTASTPTSRISQVAPFQTRISTMSLLLLSPSPLPMTSFFLRSTPSHSLLCHGPAAGGLAGHLHRQHSPISSVRLRSGPLGLRRHCRRRAAVGETSRRP
ncbi:hypothetical protein Taro_007123 [Colocasia esculenta]|uniref:Uncharacterized protein n=1 Tax=Colocasia esculenta TaxID=4460 RepID=A0A843TQG8_COLES|nr:hypothetical protein [Colocasia esculenta]